MIEDKKIIFLSYSEAPIMNNELIIKIKVL